MIQSFSSEFMDNTSIYSNHKYLRQAFARYRSPPSFSVSVLVLIISKVCFKVGLSPSKKVCVVCLTESPMKMMKNIFYFILKAFFVLNISKFL